MNNPKTWNTDEDNIVNYELKGTACRAPTNFKLIPNLLPEL